MTAPSSSIVLLARRGVRRAGRRQVDLDEAVRDRRERSRPDHEARSGRQRRVVLLDLELDLGLAVVGHLEVRHLADLHAAELDEVALHELPGVDEAGLERVAVAAAAEQEQGNKHRRGDDARQRGEPGDPPLCAAAALAIPHPSVPPDPPGRSAESTVGGRVRAPVERALSAGSRRAPGRPGSRARPRTRRRGPDSTMYAKPSRWGVDDLREVGPGVLEAGDREDGGRRERRARAERQAAPVERCEGAEHQASANSGPNVMRLDSTIGARRRHLQSPDTTGIGSSAWAARSPSRSSTRSTTSTGGMPGRVPSMRRVSLCAGTFTADPAGRGADPRGAHAGRARAGRPFGSRTAAATRATPDSAKDGRGLAVKLYLEDGSPYRPGLDHAAALLRAGPRTTSSRSPARASPTRRPASRTWRSWGPSSRPIPRPCRRSSTRSRSPRPRAMRSSSTTASTRSSGSRRTGSERWVRFSFRPRAGVAGLSDEEADERSADYLQEEIRERLEREPVEFELEVAIAQEGDDPDDPTEPWPDDRERVVVGTLRIEGLDTHPRARRRCARLRSHARHGRHRAVRRPDPAGSGPTRTRCRSSAAAARGASERASPPAHPRRGDSRGGQPRGSRRC